MSNFRRIILWIGLLFSLILPSVLKAESDSLPTLSPPAKSEAIKITGHNIICQDSMTTLFVMGLSSSEYVWTIANRPPVATTDNFTIIHPTDFNTDIIPVKVEVFETGKLLGSAQTTVYVTTKPTVIPVHDTICLDDEATLGMITSAEYFFWSTGGTTDSINIYPLVTTVCTAQVSFYPIAEAGYSNNCYTLDSAMAVVGDEPNFYIIGDSTGCQGDSITLSVVDGFGDIVWSTEETAVTIHPTIEFVGDMVFKVTASDQDGCRTTKSFTVHGLYTPNVEIWHNSDNDTICRGSSVLLVATGGESYKWNTYQTNDSIVVNPRTAFTYTVTVYSDSVSSRCSSTGSITLEVKNCDLVYFPNAISLSSQTAENRIFKPIGVPHSFNQYYLAVFNRSGQLIFESDDFDIGWNGTHQGENVHPGVYVFLFQLTNKGDVWKKVGTITVIN